MKKNTSLLYDTCITVEMIMDGRNDCELDEDILIVNCTDASLFLCLDKSRCLPNKFRCDGVQNCIDGSDEIENCIHPTMFRVYNFEEPVFVEYWLQFLQINNRLDTIVSFDSEEIFRKGTLQNVFLGLNVMSVDLKMYLLMLLFLSQLAHLANLFAQMTKTGVLTNLVS